MSFEKCIVTKSSPQLRCRTFHLIPNFPCIALQLTLPLPYFPETSDLWFSIPIVLPFPEYHVNLITYLCLFDSGFSSTHLMTSHFTHVTVRAHSFLLSSTISWYRRTTVYLFPSQRTFGMFPALGSLNHGSVNTQGQVSQEPRFWFYLDEDLGDGLCSHMTSVCLTFKKLSNCFPEPLYHSVSPQAVCESPVVLHSCQHLVRIFMFPGCQYFSRQVICKDIFPT